MVHNGKQFEEVLKQLNGNFHVLARDWENKGSADGLSDLEIGGKDVIGLVNLEAEFLLPSQLNWSKSKVVRITEIRDASWENDVPQSDPYPYWKPDKSGAVWEKTTSENREWAEKWERMINEYNQRFDVFLKNVGGVRKNCRKRRINQ